MSISETNAVVVDHAPIISETFCWYPLEIDTFFHQKQQEVHLKGIISTDDFAGFSFRETGQMIFVLENGQP